MRLIGEHSVGLPIFVPSKSLRTAPERLPSAPMYRVDGLFRDSKRRKEGIRCPFNHCSLCYTGFLSLGYSAWMVDCKRYKNLGCHGVFTGTLTQPDFGSKKYLSSELSIGKTDTLWFRGTNVQRMRRQDCLVSGLNSGRGNSVLTHYMVHWNRPLSLFKKGWFLFVTSV